MTKLYKLTPLEDNFDCNFNLLIVGVPRQLGVIGILSEWISFRLNCLRREYTFTLNQKREKLHLLLGLSKILLDIDLAISIIRGTKAEKEVIPNLMDGFSIDEPQAEFVAEIKLRHLNREYIINRTKEIESLQKEIEELESIIGSETKLKSVIASQLRGIKTKYGQPRRTQLISPEEIVEYNEEEFVEDYNVRLILTQEGYFKKITLLSLRGNDEQKFKEGDAIRTAQDATNTAELIFFTDKAQAYKAKVSDFDAIKASALGDFIPAKLEFDEGERVMAMQCFGKNESPDKNWVFIFENGHQPDYCHLLRGRAV